MVLHTFGRDLKWNPHIHCLISEGGYSDDAFWRNVSHFNYTFLRNAFRSFNRWRTAILSSFGYDPHIKEEPYHKKEDQRATRKIYFKSSRRYDIRGHSPYERGEPAGYGLFPK